MPRQFEKYAIKSRDNLGSSRFWNVRLEDIDLRIANLETALADLQNIGLDITALGLARLDDGLTPIIEEALGRLQSVGEAFNATSGSSLTIGTGAKTLVIEESSRASFIGGGNVIIHRVDNHAVFMFGAVVDYDRLSGALEVDVEVAAGAGSHNLWSVKATGPRGPQGLTGSAPNASAMPFTPQAGIAASNTAAAIVEVSGDVAALADATQDQLDDKLDMAGGTMSGHLALSLWPTFASHAVHRGYVDQMLPKSGGTMIGAITLHADPTQDLHPASRRYSDSQRGFRNTLINGAFDIWQRGTNLSASASTRFLADRWATAGGGGSTVAPSRQAFTIGQTDVPGNPNFYHRAVVASGSAANSLAVLVQRIEDVRALAGQQVTVSFYAKASATRSLSIEMVQSFGTGGSPSAVVDNIGGGKVTLSTSWQRFTRTITVPGVAGKTLGTDGNSYLGLVLWMDAGSDFSARTDSLGNQSGTFDIAMVQVESGTLASLFERRPPAIELPMCQRYYTRMALPTFAFCNVANGGWATMNINFNGRMRSTPTLTFDYTGASVSNALAAAPDQASPAGCRILITGGPAVGVNSAIIFDPANYVAADAEL